MNKTRVIYDYMHDITKKDIIQNYEDEIITSETYKKMDYYIEKQQVIIDDLKRFRYIVSDCSENEARDELLDCIDQIIFSMYANRNTDHNYLLCNAEFRIDIDDKYLVFSYYDCDKEGKVSSEAPSVVIVPRNWKSIYINEKFYCDVVDDCYEINEEGFTELVVKNMLCFDIENGNVERYEYKEETTSIFEMIISPFDKIEDTLQKIKASSKENSIDNIKANIELTFYKHTERGIVKTLDNGLKYVYDIKTYFEYQNKVIKELVKIRENISNFKDSSEKKSLVNELDGAIRSLKYFRNNYCNCIVDVDPAIYVGNHYTSIRYNYIDVDGYYLYESPSTLAFEYNLELIYFIDEHYSIIPDEYSDYSSDEYNIGYQELSFYGINYDKEEIYRVQDAREDLTGNMYDNARNDMIKMAIKMKNKVKIK